VDIFLKRPYRVHGLLYIIFIIQGFIYNSPSEILDGLWRIIISPDILVSDYVAIGGLGAAFVNVGLAGLLAVLVLTAAKHKPSGLTIGTLGLVIGFAFFGKNPVNMLPIIFGGYLYSKYSKTPYKDCILPSLLATCLAPVVTQPLFIPHMPAPADMALGIILGLFVGFIINPVGAAMRKFHEGYNLYNVGFAAGIIGLVLFAVFNLLGIAHDTVGIWSSGYNFELALFLFITSAYFVICGVLSTGGKISLSELIQISAEDNDYYKKYAEKSYIAMGMLGFACLILMFAVGGEYSGPVLGSILSVVGFGAFGKALLNAFTIVAGALLAAFAASLLTDLPFNYRGFLVATFFSTCLSPLAKRFGVKWGIIAGFLHLSLAMQIGGFHGGLNLYNNGFAGGFAAIILLPIIYFFEKREM